MSPATHIRKPEWESVYNSVKMGRSRYVLPIKSVIPLRQGYKFWLPRHRTTLDGQSYARPLWKPRNSLRYIRVEVVGVTGDELILHGLTPPLAR